MSIISSFRALHGAGAALACLLLASTAHGDPCDRDPSPDHRHCDSGGVDPGSEDLPLVIQVECDAGSLCPIASDGQGDYEHGLDGVQAELRADGNVLFNGSSAGKSTTPARGLNWYHSHDPIELSSGTYAVLEDGHTTSLEGSTYNYHSQIQINRRGDLDLAAMAVGVEHDVDLWARTVIHDPKHASIIEHRYDAKTGTGDPNAQNECGATTNDPPNTVVTQDVKIVRTAMNQWQVTAPAGTLSCALIMDPNAARPDRLVETGFDMAPFRIILQTRD